MRIDQDEWIRKLVHRRAMQVFIALENGHRFPELGEDEIGWLCLEVLNLITAGEWLEATKAPIFDTRATG